MSGMCLSVNCYEVFKAKGNIVDSRVVGRNTASLLTRNGTTNSMGPSTGLCGTPKAKSLQAGYYRDKKSI